MTNNIVKHAIEYMFSSEVARALEQEKKIGRKKNLKRL